MRTICKPLDRLIQFAEWAGATVEIVDRVPDDFSAPFSSYVGLDWDRFVLFIDRKQRQSRYVVGESIHELGHLLAVTDRPDDSTEPDFAAWEWRTAMHLGLVSMWREAMHDYVIELPGGEQADFGRTSKTEQMRWLRRCMQRGREIGNISPDGRPIMVRGPRAGQTPPDPVT